jgi:tetratricopeptide (TPR) repeat protein
MPDRRTKRLLLTAALLVWALIYPLQANITRTVRLGAGVPYVADVREGGTIAILATLGGFRSMASNMLWLRADEYFHAGAAGWYKVMPTLRAITQLDPHFIEAWELLGWHIGYNMYVQAAPEDRARWAQAAIDCYREGIALNPESWRLQQGLAWYYQDRLLDYYRAIPEWWKAARKRGGLSQPAVVLHPLAHCYEDTWQITEAVKVFKWCVRIDPDDAIAVRAIDWWSKHKNDKPYLRQLLAHRNQQREDRGLPPMLPPYDLDKEPVR